jgi:hypothetical protein
MQEIAKREPMIRKAMTLNYATQLGLLSTVNFKLEKVYEIKSKILNSQLSALNSQFSILNSLLLTIFPRTREKQTQ